jgi:putative Holliday junction resolvase
MISPDKRKHPDGRILALDLGEKRVGVAISDELQISIKRLKPIQRTNWKQLLLDIQKLVVNYSANGLVVGFPLSLDGTKGSAAVAVEETAGRFAKVLEIPIYLQDERLSSVEAAEQLRAAGHSPHELPGLIDSQAAAVILADFFASNESRTVVSPD